MKKLLAILCGVIFLIAPLNMARLEAKEVYSKATLKVLVALDGSSAIYVTLSNCDKDVWFNAPPGNDDSMVAIAIASMALDSQLFVTYDDVTMELISVGVREE